MSYLREMNGPMEKGRKGGDWLLSETRGEKMALKDLEQLTGELEKLAQLLRQETRTQARWVIMARVQEIMDLIGKGISE